MKDIHVKVKPRQTAERLAQALVERYDLPKTQLRVIHEKLNTEIQVRQRTGADCVRGGTWRAAEAGAGAVEVLCCAALSTPLWG